MHQLYFICTYLLELDLLINFPLKMWCAKILVFTTIASLSTNAEVSLRDIEETLQTIRQQQEQKHLLRFLEREKNQRNHPVGDEIDDINDVNFINDLSLIKNNRKVKHHDNKLKKRINKNQISFKDFEVEIPSVDDFDINNILSAESFHEKDRSQEESIQIVPIYKKDLKRLFQKKVNVRPKQRLEPNKLLGLPINDVKSDSIEINDLNKYSKIYVVLNKDSIGNVKPKNSIFDLLKSVGQKRNHYKRFRDDDIELRRYNRDREDDDDYRPKRSRDQGDGRGGGGSGKSRTAIPYIGQRGDIYEREYY